MCRLSIKKKIFTRINNKIKYNKKNHISFKINKNEKAKQIK